MGRICNRRTISIGDRDDSAPSIIVVVGNNRTCAVVNADYISAPVADKVIVGCSTAVFVANTGGVAVGIIEEPQLCRILAWGHSSGVAFWGQKAGCWDNPKPLKVSGIFLTSLCLGDQTRCLLV